MIKVKRWILHVTSYHCSKKKKSIGKFLAFPEVGIGNRLTGRAGLVNAPAPAPSLRRD